MAFFPWAFGKSLIDPFISSSVFDPFVNLPSFSLLDRSFTPLDKDVSAVANTSVDWEETLEAHVFKADLPDDGTLSISGERSNEKVDEKDSYRRTEGTFGKFFRQFKLPTSAKAQEISAKVENGVLIVTVPKTEESRKKSKFEMWNSQVRDALHQWTI
ncbi:HSP20 family protein [Marchantia polymorpha subsp. ruderalis]|uniref:SHSP domain-containing protein n=2 Tax=Marchantia polymorpha TaxID=3197 RepID=A0A176VKQ0_MARPO|nr:hypothetical protein AXG93_2116s1180 [Marchantia polymorpha subsp. ruderalis]PTQ33538.1 hypothetical protein MARPO_0088s0078 [Marchantia polymorpha]BBN15933.1 hypothetical protein Mp_7g02080 [Marchantia polymorpha subsp. ruderalis]|eukprot:PTQ33538.1 hypothetical protein MARPO_0088s0078 [Marchantia polymorpha]